MITQFVYSVFAKRKCHSFLKQSDAICYNILSSFHDFIVHIPKKTFVWILDEKVPKITPNEACDIDISN